MRHWLTATFLCLSSISSAIAQTADSAPPVHVKVYSNEPGLTPPKLRPLTIPPAQIDKCIRKVDGIVELSLLVDTAGVPRNIMFIHPVGNDADAFAIKIAEADRFTPGTVDGIPVLAAKTLKIKIQSCMIETKDSGGKSTFSLGLRSAPAQEPGVVKDVIAEAVLSPIDAPQLDLAEGSAKIEKVGGLVSAPAPINTPQAEYSDEAREKKIKGTCTFSMVVDRHGMPQRVQETQRLGYGLDQKAIEAISKYRFKPAMKGGEPVAVSIDIEVSFNTD